jgi:hypothetical protein
VRSGLALAGANHAKEVTSGDDGLLTALEVTGMNLYGTDLVVLSACETGVGEVKTGEGVYGLRRAFVLAGAKNLVMSLWAVNDKVTLTQMEEFYRHYGSGELPALALREAQLQSIATLRNQMKATFGRSYAPVRLWAPFIVQQTGEKPGSPQRETRSITYSRWNLAVLLLAAGGLWVLARTNLSTIPIEMRQEPTSQDEQQHGTPSVHYAHLVRQSSIETVPPEIVFFQDEVLIGSGIGCDVTIHHESLSPQHARILRRKQGYVLCDLQSEGGTYVNGRRITENLLRDGWTVRVGQVEFVFHEATPKEERRH